MDGEEHVTAGDFGQLGESRLIEELCAVLAMLEDRQIVRAES